MKRFILPALLALCCSSAMSAYAQDSVPVRGSARQDYSRLVFDWKSGVNYEIDQGTNGAVTISFSDAAQIDPSSIDVAALANISDVKVISTNPLKVMLSIPEGSKVRAFTTAQKVFLDVYNPPNAPAKPAPVQQAAAPKPAAPSQQKAVATPPAYVLTPEVVRPKPAEKTEQEVAQKKQQAITKEVVEHATRQDEHVISVNGTAAMDLAVFENQGDMWFVMDRSGFSLKPALTSKSPELFGDVMSVDIEGGSAHYISFPSDLAVKSQGGGLSWRLIFAESGKIRPNPPVIPIRKTAKSSSMREGKIIWPLHDVGKIMTMDDALTGQELIIVTVKDAKQAAGQATSFTDFDVLTSHVGLVIRPKVDDLIVQETTEGIEITRPNGLAILPDGIIPKEKHDEKPFFSPSELKPVDFKDDEVAKEAAHIAHEEKKHGDSNAHAQDTAQPSIFNFSDWKIGKLDELNRNENLILSAIKDKDELGQTEDLMRLARMYLSHGFGAEALGFLDLAQQTQPSIEESPEFKAMRGIARAFTYKSEIALADLLDKNLQDFDEIKIWRSYVLADLGDWRQAGEILPKDYSVIYNYPPYMANRLALGLAEIFLRAGKKNDAEKLLAFVEHDRDHIDTASQAALDYLRGEAHRQGGAFDKTSELWEGLKESEDDLYRTKAALAQAVLLREQKKIDNKEAINRLERLRYAWRGDQLEAQTNYWLGKFYFDNREFVKGLNIMREAAAIAVDTDLGKRIAIDMSDIFQKLFLDNDYKDVSALDAVTVYEQFNELVPPGDRGNTLVQKLAERLVEADLLERGASLLRQQVNHRLSGEEKIRVAVRLAATELLDQRPVQALSSLAIAEKELAARPDGPPKEARAREINLLKARALAKSNKSADALAILDQIPAGNDVNRLKADIAWQQGYWSDAAASLGDILDEEDISPTRPLTDRQAALIMNRAISLSLSNDRVELANMRNSYSDLMLQTNKARQFEVITRPHDNSRLSDRETLQSIISEVDLFGEFLDSYKQAGQ